MNAVAAYLPPEFLTSVQIGDTHSVFTHAVNLVFGEVMVTLVADHDAGIPDSIVLRPEDFSALHFRYGEPVRLEAKQLVFPAAPMIIDLSCPNHENTFPPGLQLASPEERKRRLSIVKQQFLAEHHLPEPVEKRFLGLLLAVNAGDFDKTEKLLLELIGLGSGLTPSADDALLGLLAVRAFLTAAGANVPLPEFPTMVHRLSAGRTTDVSRKYLRCAVQGRFSLPLVNSARLLLDLLPPIDTSGLQRLLATGHTSGLDMFRGVICSCRMI